MKSLGLFLAYLVAAHAPPAKSADTSAAIVGRWYTSADKLYGGFQPIEVTPATVSWANVCGERKYKVIQDVVVETNIDQATQLKRLASYVPAGRYRLVSIELMGAACPDGLREIQFALPIEIPSYTWIKDFRNMAWIGFPQPEPRLPLEFAGHVAWGREKGSETPNKSLEQTRGR